MKLQQWDVLMDTGDSKKVLGQVTTSVGAAQSVAKAKASQRFAPDGFTIGWKLKVKKSIVQEA